MISDQSYDIEADWTVNHVCNFRCPYCIGSFEAVRGGPTPEVARRGFDATGLTWLVHMTGGEPFLLKTLVRLCQLLTERHFISINTNLSRPLDGFERLPPDRVSFVHVGFHSRERRLRTGNRFREVFHRIGTLKVAGFTVFASQVVGPADFGAYERDFQLALMEGVVLKPKIDKGAAFGPGEVSHFLELAARADGADGNVGPGLSIDLSADAQRLHFSVTDFERRLCRSGRKFVTVDPLGNASRCLAEPLGNVFDGTLSLSAEDRRCNTFPYCRSFCLKYSIPESTCPTVDRTGA